MDKLYGGHSSKSQDESKTVRQTVETLMPTSDLHSAAGKTGSIGAGVAEIGSEGTVGSSKVWSTHEVDTFLPNIHILMLRYHSYATVLFCDWSFPVCHFFICPSWTWSPWSV